MKKTYNTTVYPKTFDGKSNIPSTIVVTASDEKDVLDFIKEKKKEIMKSDNWQSQFANDGVSPIIDYEEIEIINL
jgi:hypothetical protein